MCIRWLKNGLTCLTLVLGMVGALAVTPEKQAPKGNFDKRETLNRNGLHQANRNGERVAPAPGLRVERDELFDTPKFVFAQEGFLTGPGGIPVGAKQPAALPGDPHAPVKQFLDRNAGWMKHGSELLNSNSSRVLRDYVSRHNGQRTVVWQQQVDGLDVFGGLVIGQITKRGELAALSSQALPLAEKSVHANAKQRALLNRPAFTAAMALARALENVGEQTPEGKTVSVARAGSPGPEARQYFSGPGLRGEAYARQIWLPVTAAELRLAWETVFTSATAGRMFRTLVDAETGEVWLRHNLTKEAEPASFRVYAGDSPTPMSPGLATPLAQQPPEVPRQLITLIALNTNASPAGWIPEGVFETRGNNVSAHTDRDGNDQADLPRPTATNRVFDFALNLAQEPTNYTAAAVVNLFYWCNWMHDKLYEFGFDEASGNFQVDNFDRGGQGGDPVLADAQDGGGFNNANFSTPPRDGESPRMQMYLFNGPTPDRDGSLDAEVILHEYAHGLSDRLVGGGFGINSSQAAGMAEGWSDFVALALLSEPNDALDGNYAFAAYSARLFSSGFLTQNYYFGLRHYPYTTNLAINPLTFKDIDPSQASFHFGVPRNPAIGGSADEVHFQGEVWCVVLWDLRANLIVKHGYETGNQLAMQLVVDGMRNCPPNPTFIQARDGILLADRVNHGGANRAELWQAFSRRGLGAAAVAPRSYTTIGVVEDFSLPEDFEVTPEGGFIISGPVGGPFAPQPAVFQLFNAGTAIIDWSVTGGSLLRLSTNAGSLGAGQTNLVSVQLDSLVNSLPSGTYTQAVRFVNLVSSRVHHRTVTLRVVEPSHSLLEIFDNRDMDLGFSTLTFTPDDSPEGYQVCWQAATNFPTDPARGQPVTLGDDSYVPRVITNGGSVAIFQERSNVVYISSNGQLAMRQGNTNYFEPELHVFYEQTRASALYCDLHPGQTNSLTGELAARVLYQQEADRVAVTWLDVPEYGLNNSNSFQIELFFDGRIRMTWLALDAQRDLFAQAVKVGLSRGAGVPVDLEEMDFSASPICGAVLAVQVPSGTEGQGTITNGGLVSIPQSVAEPVVISLISSDTSKVRLPAGVEIPPGQTTARFDVAYPDNALREGPQTVRIVATATNYSPGRALVVVLDDEQSTLSLDLPGMVTEGAGVLTNVARVILTPAPDAAVLVLLSATTANSLAMPVESSVIIGAGQTSAVFSLQILDNNIIEGLSSAVIKAEVAGWGSATRMISVKDNESTALTLQLPVRVGETFGFITNAGNVAVSGPMAFDLVVLLDSANPARLQPTPLVTIRTGQTSAPVNLTVIDDAIFNLTPQVAIVASAAGFKSGTNVVLVSDDEALQPPQLIFPVSNATGVVRQPVLQWYSGYGELLVNGDFETGDFTGWAVTNSGGAGGFTINSGNYVPVQGGTSAPPLAGRFDVLIQQAAAGVRTLAQTVAIPSQPGSIVLSWRDRIRNAAADFNDRQQFRVEVQDAAGVRLATAFSTQPGDSRFQSVTRREVNLDPWRGQTIRLAFIEEDSLGALNVTLDDLSLRLIPVEETLFEVYLGTNASTNPRLGVTSNNTFTVTNALLPGTVYYWQVVTRRGSLTNASPVYTFATLATNDFYATVRILDPGNNSVFLAPASLTLRAEAFANRGVAMVDFYRGSTWLGSTTNAPYEFSWSIPSPGSYTVRARVYDSAGVAADSPPVTITVVSAASNSISLIGPGAQWKYLDDGSDPGEAWRQPGYDDTLWKTGVTKFGYGASEVNTTVESGPDPNNRHITTYFRTTFTNLADLTDLRLDLMYDDGAIIWINGSEIRLNMPPYPIISFNTRAVQEISGASRVAVLQPFVWLVSNGVNTVAVEVHKFTNNSPGLIFDLALTGQGNPRPNIALVAPTNGALLPGGQPLTIAAQATDVYGQIAQVEFFADDLKLGEDAAAPFALTWTNPLAGTHKLFAVATDNAGASVASEPLWVAVGVPSLLSAPPTNGWLRLAWPSGADGFRLEASFDLPTTNWLAITNLPAIQEGLKSVLVPMDLQRRYFRLRQP